MKFQFDRKSAALILFGAAFLLLIANITLSIIKPDTVSQKDKTILSISEIDSLFLLSLHSFGIRDEWIIERKNPEIKASYKVKVPSDLSIPVILTEVNSNFWGTSANISSTEKDFSGSTVLEINTEKKLQLRAEFNYDDKIQRSAGKLAFVLEGFELADSEDSLLLEIPEPFSPLLIPSTKNLRIAKYILQKKKTFSVLLNDNIPELKYKLKSGYSNKRLKESLLSIIHDFSGASFFFIDDNSDLFISSSFNYLRDELVKRKIKFVRTSNLKKLDFENEKRLKNTFDDFVKKMGEGESIAFLINKNGFLKLLPEIQRFRKIGYKVVHYSETIIPEVKTNND